MTMTRSGSKFTHHTDCPKCGSRDNLAVYEDGTGYCFSIMPDGSMCGYKKNVEDMEMEVGQESYAFHHEAAFRNLPRRGINKETCEYYRVTYADRKLYFPLYHEGRYVACKYRTPDKQFRWIQSSRQCKLFGLNTIVQFKKTLIITEGELDALAVHQMYQGQKWKHNVVSVVSGASGAVGDISTHIEYLSKFDKIYICFDNDEPGRIAAKACMDLFDPGKAYLVELPPQYKDPNEMLLAGAEREFYAAIEKAVANTPKGMLTQEEQVQGTLEYLFDPQNRKGIPTGFKHLDNLIGGFHKGEVIGVVGGTGTGKSRFVMDLAYNISIEADNPVKSYVIPLEMPYQHVMGLFLERYLGKPILSDPDNLDAFLQIEEHDKEKVLEAAKALTKGIGVYNHIGSLTIEGLETIIKSAVRSEGAQVVILDHKDQAVSGEGSADYRTIDHFMAKTQELAMSLGITIIVVSHQSRAQDDKDDVKASLNRIRGSQGFAQNCSCVLGLERPRDSQFLTVKTLKAHRLVGRYGEIVLKRDLQQFKYVEPQPIKVNEVADGEVEREEEVSEPVREERVSVQPVTGVNTNIRTEGGGVPSDLCAGLPPDNEDREKDIHRDKGETEGHGQKQIKAGTCFQSRAGLEALVSELQGKVIPQAPFSQLRLVGREKRIQVE